MKVAGYIAMFPGGCAIVWLLFSPGFVETSGRETLTQQEPDISLPTYLSFISVMLTSVTVVLAAPAIGIGVVAFYTIREIKDEAQKTASAIARKEASAVASDALSEIRVKEIVGGLVGQHTQESERIEE